MKTEKIKLNNEFAPYPEYKDSGIEWIGKTPKEWKTNKLKNLTKINALTLSESTAENFVMQYLDIGNVGTGCINLPEEVVFSKAPSRARRKVTKGSVIIATVRTYLKAIAYFENPDDNLIVSTGFSVLDSSEELFSKYLYYHTLSESFTQKVIAFSTGVSYPAITPVNLGNIITLIPPFETQKKIAEYLDEKTELIDAIIERKQRLIELLREKRTAVINQAVTKGLDPNVELVDSGIEWIGKIPKGWKKQRLGYEAIISVGNKDVNEGNPDGEYPFFTCSKERTFSDNYSFDLEALLIAGNGEVGLTQYYKGKFEAYQRTYVLWGFKNNPQYFRYYIASLLPIALLNQSIGSVISYIKKGDLTHFPILIPTIREQKDIVEYLDNKMQSLDTLLKKAEKSIEKLQEFKTSLISNVVTGKIVV